MKRISILCGACISLLLICGCAAEKQAIRPSEQKPNIEIRTETEAAGANAGGISIPEKGAPYRLEKTPFGVVKRYDIPSSEAPKTAPVEKQGKVASLAETRGQQIGVKRTPFGDVPTGGGIPAPLPASKTEVSRGKEAPPEVVFNFDDADLYEVIRTMAEILGINYLVDPNIAGRVTIHTAGMLKRDDLFPVFYQILEVNGLTAVKEGSLYRIVKITEAPRLSVQTGMEPSEGGSPYSRRIIIQIIPLKYISAEEMTKLLSPFISPEGTIIVHDNSNTLIVADKGINILKALKLVETFDVDVFEKVHYRFFPIENAESEQIVKMLEGIFKPAASKASTDLRFLSIERLNTVLTLSSNLGIFPKVEEFIRRFDVPNESTEPEIYIYAVKNGTADQLADLLNEVFSKTAAGKKTAAESTAKEAPEKEQKGVSSPFASTTTIPKKEKQTTLSGTVPGSPSNKLKGDIRITPDEIRNALIIEATPADFRVIENILKEIDVMPRQVLIEATIAEISLDTSNKMGVEWNYVKVPGGGSTALQSAATGSAGLKFVIGQADKWSAAISALATKNKVNILSAPTLLASDNKEAKIDITTEVPVPNAQYQYTSGTEPVIETNIQYRNTGVILTVKPHINANGQVSMDVSQEVSEQSDSVQIGNINVPSFFKRSVATSLTVKHGQTIVIGGLMRNISDRGVTGVPGLSRIPVLGWLFGQESRSTTKTELIILLTPWVIVNLQDVDTVTAEFKTKLGGAIREADRVN